MAAHMLITFTVFHSVALNMIVMLFLLSIVVQNLQTEVSSQDLVTKPIISFCVGTFMTCAVFQDNNFKCWGATSTFGEGYSTYGSTPTSIGDNIPYFYLGNLGLPIKVSCGYDHICILFDNNVARCVGYNSYGQIGIGVTSSNVGSNSGHYGTFLPAVDVGAGLNMLDIEAANKFTLVRVSGNKMKSFGLNDFGQLGYCDTTNRGTSSALLGSNLPYVNFGTNVEISSMFVSGHGAHSCVLILYPITYSQRIKCWGNNGDYQLGYGTQLATSNIGDAADEMGDNLPYVDLGAESRVKTASFGWAHTCVLLLDEYLKCFGKGEYGKLGSGSTSTISLTGNSLSYVQINLNRYIKILDTGISHNCILYEDEITVKCFGWNGYGQLGLGDTTDRGGTPTTKIPNLPSVSLGTGTTKIKSIQCGYSHTCILFVDNKIKCMGWNYYGQFAIGNSDTIGDIPSEMGSNLNFSIIFSPTTSPTRSPTRKPTVIPTLKPTSFPTLNPSKSPTLNPTRKPTITPTTSPTQSPIDEASLRSATLGAAIAIPIVLLAVSTGIFFYCRNKKTTSNVVLNNANSTSHVELPVATSVDGSGMVNPPLAATVTVKSNSIAVATVVKKKYIAMISNIKDETGIVASLMMQEAGEQMKKKKVKNSDIFLDEMNNNNQIVSERVQESSVVVALLSKSYFTNTRCLLEWAFAVEYSIPIVLVSIAGSGFNIEDAKESLGKIREGNVGTELIEMGIVLDLFLPRVLEILLSRDMDKYDPNDQKRLRDVQIEIIVEHIIDQAKEKY